MEMANCLRQKKHTRVLHLSTWLCRGTISECFLDAFARNDVRSKIQYFAGEKEMFDNYYANLNKLKIWFNICNLIYVNLKKRECTTRNIYSPMERRYFLAFLPGRSLLLFHPNFFSPLPCLFSVPSHLFSASLLRFDSLPCVSETYTWQVRFRPSRRKRPPDCREDVFRRCPRSPSVSSLFLHRGRRGFLRPAGEYARSNACFVRQG